MSPLLPPTEFLHVDGQTKVSVNTIDDARYLYKYHQSFYSNKYNQRKFVRGALYKNIFSEGAHVIEPVPGSMIELEVYLHDGGATTLLYITCDMNISNPYLSSLNQLGNALSCHQPNTSWRTKNDLGAMYIVGNGKKGDGSRGSYNLTNTTDSIKSAISNVKAYTEKYYTSIGLFRNLNEKSSSSQRQY